MTPLHQRMLDAMTARGLAERSALEQPCTLRGRLGLRRRVTVWGGADVDAVKANVDAARADNPGVPVPVDLVTASASGFDPHVSPAAADFQVLRVARERGVPELQIRQLVAAHTEGRTFGLLGEARVNVLELNLELDAQYPVKH